MSTPRSKVISATLLAPTLGILLAASFLILAVLPIGALADSTTNNDNVEFAINAQGTVCLFNQPLRPHLGVAPADSTGTLPLAPPLSSQTAFLMNNYRWATSQAFSFVSTGEDPFEALLEASSINQPVPTANITCDGTSNLNLGPTCNAMSPTNGQAYTSDYFVSQFIQTGSPPSDGEAYYFTRNLPR